jgi:hypothetical protein
MRAIVIGFPKCGTSTIHQACKKSGLRSAHWKAPGKGYCGALIYQNYLADRDPLADLSDYDVVSQMDVCVKRTNFWPNLDLALLLRIRKFHPECSFILNTRAPEKIASSIARWGNLRKRITAADIIGLPRRYGDQDVHLVRWVEQHFEACRRLFGSDEKFFELPIEASNAREILEKAVGTKIKWWGVANKNERRQAPAA